MEQNETFPFSKRQNWEGFKSTDTEGLRVMGPTKSPPVFPFSSCSPRAAAAPAALCQAGVRERETKGKLDVVAAWGGSSLFWAVFRVRLEMRALRGSSCLLQGRREMWGSMGCRFSRCLGSPMDLSPWTPLIHRGASGPTWSLRHLQEGELHTFGVCPEEPQPLLDLSPQLRANSALHPFGSSSPFFPSHFPISDPQAAAQT